jgi:hypothetical protein
MMNNFCLVFQVGREEQPACKRVVGVSYTFQVAIQILGIR